MKQLHSVQLGILQKLLFAPSLRYGEMKPDPRMENNQFDFHLDSLIDAGFIRKIESGYTLTDAGKEYANRIDTEESIVAKQAKITTLICSTRMRNSERQYLIFTRLKQPFYGCQGFMSGKVKYGERIIDTARRELKEETNLDGEPVLVCIRHYRVFDKKSNTLVEDKFMHFCKVEDPTGELNPNNEGKFEWVAESRLKEYETNHFESWEAFQGQLEEVNSFYGRLLFKEIDYYTDKF